MAEFVLPSRGTGPGGRQRAGRVPTAENVPTARVASDPGVRVPAGAFDNGGAALETAGQAMAGFGEKLFLADQRIKSREETVALVKAIGSYNEAVNAEFRRIETEDDISSPETMKAFGSYLSKTQNDLLEGYKGSEAGKLDLQERLEAIRSDITVRGAVASVNAQKKVVADQVSQTIKSITARATENPGEVDSLFKSFDSLITDMAPALTPEEETTYRRSGREEIVKSAVSSLTSRGDWKSAKSVVEMAGVKETLSPDTQRAVNMQIVSAERESTKLERDAKAKLDFYVRWTGEKPSKAIIMDAAGFKVSDRKPTASEDFAEYTRITGKAPTPEQVAKRLNMDAGGDSGNFGSGITGRALDIITEDSAAFAAGLLNENQERRYMAAVTQYTQPIQYQNPDTGMLEMRRPELPAFAADAMKTRGVSRDQPPPAGTGGEAAPPSDDGAGPENQGQPSQPAQTIWGLTDLTAGPIPAAAEAIARTPGIGNLFPATEFTQARNFIPVVQRDLIRVLQNNPRYAEGERKAIESEINIKPEIWDNPSAARNRLISLDQALEVREQNAFETSRSPNVGREERIQAMNVLNAITKFRMNMGVPPRVKTPDEARKLPSGTQFIDPSGNIRVVPEGAGAEKKKNSQKEETDG